MIVTGRGIVASKEVLPAGGDLTLASILEYAAAVRSRYLRGSVREKKAILDEFCKATGRHRKSAIRLLHRGRTVAGKRRGRPRQYGAEFALALKVAWEATDCICSKRLAPFLKELVPILERHGELRVSEAVRGQLMHVSVSTIDRILAPYRLKPRRGLSTTRSVSHLRRLIPIRTFADKKGLNVGCLEVDLVAHCGTPCQKPVRGNHQTAPAREPLVRSLIRGVDPYIGALVSLAPREPQACRCVSAPWAGTYRSVTNHEKWDQIRLGSRNQR